MSGGPNDPGTPALGIGAQNTLAELIDEAQTPIVKGEDVSIDDTANHFTGDTVEEALAEASVLAGGNTFVGEQELNATTDTSAETLASITPAHTNFSGDLLELAGTGKGWSGRVLVWDTQGGTGGYIDDAGEIQLDAGVSIYQDGDEYATQTWVDTTYATSAEVTADILTHNADISTAGTAHGLKGVGLTAAAGENETANVDEVKLLTLSAGASGDHFKLEFNANKSNFITIPAGGYTDVTAADIKAALITIADWVTNTADINVVENPANTFEITFTNDLGWSNIGNLTVPAGDLTGDLVGTPPVVVDDGTGASTVGVNGTDYINVEGIAPGDLIGRSLMYYWGDPANGGGWNINPSVTERPATDFECRVANEIGVVANPANYSASITAIFSYLDLT